MENAVLSFCFENNEHLDWGFVLLVCIITFVVIISAVIPRHEESVLVKGARLFTEKCTERRMVTRMTRIGRISADFT